MAAFDGARVPCWKASVPIHHCDKYEIQTGTPHRVEAFVRCGVALQPLVDALRAILLKRAVLHADETPVPMLKPSLGRKHRAYLWSYSSSEYDELPAVIYDFNDSRSGLHMGQRRRRGLYDDHIR